MSALTILGLAAGFCTTLAFLPQVIKTYRTRSTADISLGMFLVMVLGIILWLIYGALLGDLPLIAANSVTLFLAGAILALKIKHG
jgi:MtN3 and saliva related transmembrane protein